MEPVRTLNDLHKSTGPIEVLQLAMSMREVARKLIEISVDMERSCCIQTVKECIMGKQRKISFHSLFDVCLGTASQNNTATPKNCYCLKKTLYATDKEDAANFTLSDLAIALTTLNAAEVVHEAMCSRWWEKDQQQKNKTVKKRKKDDDDNNEEQEVPMLELRMASQAESGAEPGSTAANGNSSNTSAKSVSNTTISTKDSSIKKKKGEGYRRKATEEQKEAEMINNQYENYQEFRQRYKDVLLDGSGKLKDNGKLFADVLEQTRRQDEYCKRKEGTVLDKENNNNTRKKAGTELDGCNKWHKTKDLVPGLESMFSRGVPV